MVIHVLWCMASTQPGAQVQTKIHPSNIRTGIWLTVITQHQNHCVNTQRNRTSRQNQADMEQVRTLSCSWGEAPVSYRHCRIINLVPAPLSWH